MKTLVGSQALLIHLPDVRAAKDTDYFADSEIEGAETFYHPALENWAWGEVATLDELYTIKVSHSFWELRNGSWNKHMHDVLILQNAGAKFIPELHAILYPIWVETHGKKKANLEQSPEEFFNENIHRVYEHDSIHASVAYYDEPLFNAILRDGHAVAVDKSKFDTLSQEDKFRLVREEVYATALERKVISSGYTANRGAAYTYALRRTVTSFTKGWFPLFIVLNYMELRKPDLDYVQKHRDNAHLLVPLEEPA